MDASVARQEQRCDLWVLLVIVLMVLAIGGLAMYLAVQPSLRWAVVDLQPLIHVQVEKLRQQPGGLKAQDAAAVLEQQARTATQTIQAAITHWGRQHQTVIFNKQAVLSSAPDVTPAIQQLLEE